MARMGLDYGSSRFTSQILLRVSAQRGTAHLTSKLQVSRLSIREPETPPLPSWFGSWVASLICESSVSRSKRNSSPGVRRHRSASLRSWLGCWRDARERAHPPAVQNTGGFWPIGSDLYSRKALASIIRQLTNTRQAKTVPHRAHRQRSVLCLDTCRPARAPSAR